MSSIVGGAGSLNNELKNPVKLNAYASEDNSKVTVRKIMPNNRKFILIDLLYCNKKFAMRVLSYSSANPKIFLL